MAEKHSPLGRQIESEPAKPAVKERPVSSYIISLVSALVIKRAVPSQPSPHESESITSRHKFARFRRELGLEGRREIDGGWKEEEEEEKEAPAKPHARKSNATENVACISVL
jgi:hypothetical protein